MGEKAGTKLGQLLYNQMHGLTSEPCPRCAELEGKINIAYGLLEDIDGWSDPAEVTHDVQKALEALDTRGKTPVVGVKCRECGQDIYDGTAWLRSGRCFDCASAAAAHHAMTGE